jgi:signal transduction histidine kinase
VEWLNRNQPNVEMARETAAAVVKAGQRAAEIIDHLRSLYKKAPPQRQLLDLNEIIGEIVTLLRGEANLHAVSIRTDLAADLPEVTGDRVQLQQVLMNLMLNAIEAMRETGGMLTLKSRLNDEGRAQISVDDTGPGLPVGKKEHIFEAFFTTKAQGSGMGLAISRSIIESHGGRLWATVNAGRGATFHFTLPTKTEGTEAA